MTVALAIPPLTVKNRPCALIWACALNRKNTVFGLNLNSRNCECSQSCLPYLCGTHMVGYHCRVCPSMHMWGRYSAVQCTGHHPSSLWGSRRTSVCTGQTHLQGGTQQYIQEGNSGTSAIVCLYNLPGIRLEYRLI